MVHGAPSRLVVRAMLALVAVIVAVIVGLRLSGVHPGVSMVKALLDETGIEYQIRECYGGWLRRNMHCELTLSPDQLDVLVTKLGLDESMPYFEEEKRLVLVPQGENPCSAKFRARYVISFDIQQWQPTRHGFASAIFFYDKSAGRGCLFLSIAYG